MTKVKSFLKGSYIGRSGIIVTALVTVFIFYEKIYSGYLYGEIEPGITVVNGETVRKAIDESRGKVVLLNLWASWCEPCVDEFPEMVGLYNKYRSWGLEVITVSFDFNDRIDEDVIPFLVEQEAYFQNFMQDENTGDQEFLEAIDRDINGVLPTTILYDRKGMRKYIIHGRFEEKDLEEKIVGLLDLK